MESRVFVGAYVAATIKVRIKDPPGSGLGEEGQRLRPRLLDYEDGRFTRSHQHGGGGGVDDVQGVHTATTGGIAVTFAAAATATATTHLSSLSLSLSQWLMTWDQPCVAKRNKSRGLKKERERERRESRIMWPLPVTALTGKARGVCCREKVNQLSLSQEQPVPCPGDVVSPPTRAKNLRAPRGTTVLLGLRKLLMIVKKRVGVGWGFEGVGWGLCVFTRGLSYLLLPSSLQFPHILTPFFSPLSSLSPSLSLSRCSMFHCAHRNASTDKREEANRLHRIRNWRVVFIVT